VALGLLALAPTAQAEVVFVKYRGPVDLAPFQCESVTRSSLVRRVCYDQQEQYMIINLNGTYHHYCEIGPTVVANLLRAESMGRYYNAAIKGNFDCRVYRVPPYKYHSRKTGDADNQRSLRPPSCRPCSRQPGRWP